ncbi:MAG: YceI family protein [Gammaproteobacteria bacterium]|nr:MAG: YceI family protein [Gammaproteobacteria bacterium]
MQLPLVNSVMKPLALGILLSLAHPSIAEVAAPGNYRVDPDHSTILFAVNHLGTSVLTGRFNTFEGSFALDPDQTPRVDVSIKTASVDTNHEKRDAHLRSPDFFNVKQFPVMRFVADKVDYDTHGQPTTLHGKLSLHGKTKPVALDLSPIGAGKDPWGGYRAGFNAKTVLKRSDFGMDFMPGGIGDEITVTLNIEAIKE